MKKIKILFGFLLVFLLDMNSVYAYVPIESYKFENYMKAHDYDVLVLEDGPSAVKRTKSCNQFEEYQYRSFDDNQSALLYLKNSYQDFEESSLEHHFEQSYNVKENQNDDYSYFAVDGDFMNLGSQYYYYAVKYQNIVISASCAYEYREIVKKNIQNLFQGVKIKENKNTTIFLDLKNMVVRNYLFIILAVFSIVILLTFIKFGIFRFVGKKR